MLGIKRYNLINFYTVLFGVSFVLLPFIFVGDIYMKEIMQFSTFIILSSICFYFTFIFSPKVKCVFLKLNFRNVAFSIYALFVISFLITLFTASKIPLIESLKGTDRDTLNVYRELFLKARSGWQLLLSYINAVITGAVFPFIILLAFERNEKFRYLFLITFLVYSISFLEKAYFLKFLIPFMYFKFVKSSQKKLFLIYGSVLSISFLVVMALLAGMNDHANDDVSTIFFSTQFKGNNPLETILWRGIVIPVITALDGLKVFAESFNSNYFYGATSSFMATIAGIERINFERELFFNQWGQNETETGNANAVYLLEAYVNFGYCGVVIFSFIAALSMKVLVESCNLSSKSLVFLFIFNLFNAGLIGTLLSNGFLFLLMLVKFCKFK